ncbi:MAG: hypothetical protein KDK29_02560 [Sedimentitalea sp.]|nr:hypothetical protein [Sedimentitalea sp.]
MRKTTDTNGGFMVKAFGELHLSFGTDVTERKLKAKIHVEALGDWSLCQLGEFAASPTSADQACQPEWSELSSGNLALIVENAAANDVRSDHHHGVEFGDQPGMTLTEIRF